MARTKTKSLLEEVAEEISEKRAGFQAWHERLAPDLRAEVLEIKAAFQRGDLKVKRAVSVARVLAAKLAERGIVNLKPETFSRWLKAQD